MCERRPAAGRPGPRTGAITPIKPQETARTAATGPPIKDPADGCESFEAEFRPPE